MSETGKSYQVTYPCGSRVIVEGSALRWEQADTCPVCPNCRGEMFRIGDTKVFECYDRKCKSVVREDEGPSELDCVIAERDAFKGSLVLCQSERDSVRKALGFAESDRDILRAAAKRLETDKATVAKLAEKDRRVLKGQIKDLRDNIEAVREECAELNAENADLKGENSALRESVEGLKVELSAALTAQPPETLLAEVLAVAPWVRRLNPNANLEQAVVGLLATVKGLPNESEITKPYRRDTYANAAIHREVIEVTLPLKGHHGPSKPEQFIVKLGAPIKVENTRDLSITGSIYAVELLDKQGRTAGIHLIPPDSEIDPSSIDGEGPIHCIRFWASPCAFGGQTHLRLEVTGRPAT